MKDYARSFYRSNKWKKCRAAYFKYRFGLCERCSSTGKIVHHKIYLTPKNINNPSITLDFNNLELLCQDCHNKEHHQVYDCKRENVLFDCDGNLIQKNLGDFI